MGTVYDQLTPELTEFIEAQQLFFVATAPLSGDGHLDLPPKGMDSLRVLDTTTVAYLDLTGSGAETVAHIKEKGRLLLTFCAFAGKPLILRLHGRGTVIETADAEFDQLRPNFGEFPGVRSIIKLDIERVADSCGWNVPLYAYEGTRDYYHNFAEKLGTDGIRAGQLAMNMHSIDGLPALKAPSL